MDVSEIVALLVAKGVDRVLAELPNLIREKKIEKDDLQLILLYALIENTKSMNSKLDEIKNGVNVMHKDLVERIDVMHKGLAEKIDAMHKDLAERIDTMHKDLRERLDLVINQMRVLNSNIAATYELTSKVVAKLMERGIAPLG